MCQVVLKPFPSAGTLAIPPFMHLFENSTSLSNVVIFEETFIMLNIIKKLKIIMLNKYKQENISVLFCFKKQASVFICIGR